MRGAEQYFYEILRNSEQLVIPIYQRNYDWTEKQCEQLFDDLIQLHNNLKEHKGNYHFFGSIVYKKIEEERKSFHLIDGQQRVVTVSLLLKAIIDEFDKETCIEKQFIEEELLKNKYIEGDRKIRLRPDGEDRKVYDSIIDGNYSIYENTGSRIVENYKYLKERVHDSNLTLIELLNVIKKLQVIEITLEYRDDAQIIFESLNSTGLALKESDKIRNKILMNLSEDKQRAYYYYWHNIENSCKYLNFEQFIRDYFTIHLRKIPKQDDLYGEFKNNIYDKVGKYGFKNLEEFLKDMSDYGERYQNIHNGKIGNKNTNKILKRLYSLKQEVITPYIMQLIAYKDEGNLDEKDLSSILECIETYLFRRTICNIPTNGLNKIFSVLHKYIIEQMKKCDLSYIDILKNELIRRKFPNDEIFKNNFKENDIYNIRNIKPYIFTQLENELRKNITEKEKLNIEDFDIRSIEHIMPQKSNKYKDWEKDLGNKYDKIYETYLHRISNLTIADKINNTTLSNKQFSKKLKDDNPEVDYDYTRSGYELTRQTILDDEISEKWNEIPQEERGEYFEEFLIRRGNKLADIACERWKMLVETQYKSENYEEKDISLNESYDYKDATIKSFTFDETIEVENLTDMFIKVIELLYKKDPDIIYNEIRDDDTMPSTSNFIINKTVKELFIKNNPDRESRVSHKINDYIYIYTGTNNNTKIKQLRYLFDKYELKYGEYEISKDNLIFTIIDEQ